MILKKMRVLAVNTAAGFVAIVPAVVNPIIASVTWHASAIVASKLTRTAPYNVITIITNIIIISSSSSSSNNNNNNSGA